MNDGQIWTKFLKASLQPHGVFDRIENSVANGMPDITYTVQGATGFMETKLLHGEDKFFLQRWQIPWHARRVQLDPAHFWFFIYDPMSSICYLASAKNVLRMPSRPSGERHNEFTLSLGLVELTARRENFPWSRLANHLAHG